MVVREHQTYSRRSKVGAGLTDKTTTVRHVKDQVVLECCSSRLALYTHHTTVVGIGIIGIVTYIHERIVLNLKVTDHRIGIDSQECSETIIYGRIDYLKRLDV